LASSAIRGSVDVCAQAKVEGLSVTVGGSAPNTPRDGICQDEKALGVLGDKGFGGCVCAGKGRRPFGYCRGLCPQHPRDGICQDEKRAWQEQAS